MNWMGFGQFLGNSLLGRRDGAAPRSGVIGEIVESSVSSLVSLTTGQWLDHATITPGAGVWDIYASVRILPAATTVVTNARGAVSTNNGNNSTGVVSLKNVVEINYPTGYVPRDAICIFTQQWRQTITQAGAAQAYYAKTYADFTTSTAQGQGYIRAIRVG